jgi:hypothetical protein
MRLPFRQSSPDTVNEYNSLIISTMDFILLKKSVPLDKSFNNHPFWFDFLLFTFTKKIKALKIRAFIVCDDRERQILLKWFNFHTFYFSFNSLALMATITVLKLIRTAPIAGLSMK